MLERELRQRELQNDLSYSALVPVFHPPPLPVSPGLHGCLLDEDLATAGTSNYASVYKYKPVYECDFQFYQLFHLKSRSSAESDCNDVLCQSSEQEMQNSWRVCEKKEGEETIPLPLQQRLKHHGSKSSSETTEIMDSGGLDEVIAGGPEVSAASRTSDPLTAKSWCTDIHTDQAGAHADSVKCPHGSSVRTAAVRPLPFSVEALLRA